MSLQERTGVRDLTFSTWHRTIGDHCAYLDIDCIEYCRSCHKVLAVIETVAPLQPKNLTASVRNKPTTFSRYVARKLDNAPCYVIGVVRGDTVTTAFVLQVEPIRREIGLMTAEELADFIRGIHVCPNCNKKSVP